MSNKPVVLVTYHEKKLDFVLILTIKLLVGFFRMNNIGIFNYKWCSFLEMQLVCSYI